MTTYPTKEEILSHKDLPANPQAIIVLKNFKKQWREVKECTDNGVKFALIKLLLDELSIVFQVEKAEIILGDQYSYNPSAKKIKLGKVPSIISSLHEFGHHLYGHSELLACVFSVNHFKEAFPIAYKKLRWDGHMLKQ